MSYVGHSRTRRRLSVGRPRRRSTTIKLQDKATFRGKSYSVYGRRGAPIGDRVIFADDPEFKSTRTPIGAKFRVTYLGRPYTAHKSIRLVAGRTVPVLEFDLPE